MRAPMRALALAVALAACSEVGPFYCDDNSQCMVDDEVGTCVLAENLCAWPDPQCPAPMLRYDESAGELADVCVGDE